MTRRHRAALATLVLLSACGGSEPGPGKGPAAGDDTAEPDSAAPERCGTAGDTLADDLVVLEFSTGAGDFTVQDIDFEVDGQVLNEDLLHEAVRFELPHPAEVHGFSVQWGVLPEGEDTEVEAGLYGDFGYNGFDFWAPEPLWTGTRCAGELEAGGWSTYALDAPVALDHPGLVYVAHARQGFDDKALAFDVDTVNPDGTCEAWTDCSSALNLPEAQDSQFFNGTSFPFQYNYKVRLHVRYTDDLDPAEARFQATASLDVDEDGDGALDPVPLGNRAAWGDYDGDGWDDLFSTSRLFRNNGDGTFSDVTTDAGIDAAPARSGGVWGDYDNDGVLDLLVFAESYSSGDTLFRGNGDGTFSDVTVAAGIDDTQDYEDCGDAEANTHAPTPGAAWLDIDGDGLLDLYLSNFICWDSFTFYRDDVYRNQGDGTFARLGRDEGWSNAKRSGRGASPADADGDGDIDLLVNNYTLQQNLYYENQGDGTVVERGGGSGLGGDGTLTSGSQYYGHTIGAAWGDLDNDGDLDAIAANLAHPRFFHFSNKTQVLMNQGGGTWVDIQGDWDRPEGAAGLRFQETHSVPVLADFDLDGVLDLAISAVYPGRPTDFYWGNGDGTFRLDAYHAGIDVVNGWGMAAADWDRDGDPDLATRGVLFENTGDDAGHWLQVRPLGTAASNRAGIGATVRVESGGVTRVRVVSGGNGQGGQDSAFLDFGLGGAAQVDAVEVDFPGAGTVRFEGPFDADQRLWVLEDGRTHTGWAPPTDG
jgi:hypothetical protein